MLPFEIDIFFNWELFFIAGRYFKKKKKKKEKPLDLSFCQSCHSFLCFTLINDNNDNNVVQGLFLEVRACIPFFRKRAKYLEIWAKMYKIWKYFEKRQVIACNYCMQQTTRIGPVVILELNLNCDIKIIWQFLSGRFDLLAPSTQMGIDISVMVEECISKLCWGAWIQAGAKKNLYSSKVLKELKEKYNVVSR